MNFWLKHKLLFFEFFEVLLGLAIVPWIFDGYRLVREAFATIRYPFPTCTTELVVLDGIQKVAHHESLFPPLSELPFSIHVYNTLNYLPGGLAGNLWSLSIDQMLTISRIVPLLCGLGLLVVCAAYAWTLSRNWLLTGFTALAILAYHSATLTDFFRNRPETPGLFFSFLGFFLVAVDSKYRPKVWPYLSALCFAIAFGFKQVFISAPLAVGLYLVMDKSQRSALFAFCLTYLNLILIGTLTSFYWLGSGYFQHTYLSMSTNPFDFLKALQFFWPTLYSKYWGFSLLVGFLFAVLDSVRTGMKAGPSKKIEPIWYYFLICLILTLIFSSKTGADFNYFGELSVLIIMGLVVSLARRMSVRDPLALFLVAPMLVSIWWGIYQYGSSWNQICLNRADPTPNCFSDQPPFGDRTKAVERYRAYPKNTLILDSEIGIRSGHTSVNDWFLLSLLFDNHFLKFDHLREAVDSRYYQTIVFNMDDANDWTKKLLVQAYRDGYRPTPLGLPGLMELQLKIPIHPSDRLNQSIGNSPKRE
jgi:hypothetical protein